jgi:uncharacterized protein YukE
MSAKDVYECVCKIQDELSDMYKMLNTHKRRELSQYDEMKAALVNTSAALGDIQAMVHPVEGDCDDESDGDFSTTKAQMERTIATLNDTIEERDRTIEVQKASIEELKRTSAAKDKIIAAKDIVIHALETSHSS